jgi:hypothetical protein
MNARKSENYLAHCKHILCNTLTYLTNEDLLNIKRKGDPKSCTLSRTSDTTETRNPCVIKVILLACFNVVSLNRAVVPYEISKVNCCVEAKILVSMSEEI